MKEYVADSKKKKERKKKGRGLGGGEASGSLLAKW